jgi:Protein of unknown function (DUF2569)
MAFVENVAQFVPLLVLAAIVAGVLLVVRRRQAPSAPGKLAGFGGLLLLLAIGQTLVPFRTLLGIGQSFGSLEPLSALPNGRAVFYAELALNLLLLVFSCVVTAAMWRRSPQFPRLFTWQWLAALVIAFLEPALVAGATGLPAATLYSDPEVVRTMAQAAAMGVWVWYVRKSVRVRNTFGGDIAANPVEAARLFE